MAKRLMVSAVAFTALALGGLAAAPAQAAPATTADAPAAVMGYLGGLDFNHYCKEHKYVRATLAGVVKTVESWRCVDAKGDNHGIDRNYACRWTYPGKNARYGYREYYDPYSLYCQN